VANSHKNFKKPGEYRKKKEKFERKKKNPPKSVYTIKKKQPNSSDRLHFLCTTEIMLLENDTPLT